MRISYKNRRLEQATIAVNTLATAAVVATFVLLFGYEKPLLPANLLYTAQIVLLCVFTFEKIVRILNAASIKEYFRFAWLEIPLLIGLFLVLLGSSVLFDAQNVAVARHAAIGIYLVLDITFKLCRTTISLAASGHNSTRVFIFSFLFLVFVGGSLLSLPRASAGQEVSFIDALFTATSATCVTGLTVNDVGKAFSLPGQMVILALIQLGGLGIVIFGAVFALMLGQALSLRESVAMRDIISDSTLGRIGNMIVFIVLGTFIIEGIGAVGLYSMWDNIGDVSSQQKWFYSIFHSISAFCNAGFALFTRNLIDYNHQWQVYGVIASLIIVGGLGFGVLYNVTSVIIDKVKRLSIRIFRKDRQFNYAPIKLKLQSKIVLTVSALLIVGGMVMLLIFEHFTGKGALGDNPVAGAYFQSVTARTAGFNSIDIAALSEPAKFILIVLMFIGGSPGSTAGGIKTVTFAVLVVTVIASLRKRREVEIFHRSIGIGVVGKALTVTFLFMLVLFTSTFLLSITERNSGFGFIDILFEVASALGTVGLSAGLTPSLTTAGKLIIITTMLIGRLGPLTLLAELTFNLKPAKYSYVEESVIVG